MKTTFGRRIRFDERSRDFPIRALLRPGLKPRSYTWSCPLWLNQANLPACTGFAVAHEAAARPAPVQGITAKIAREVYYRAQELDEWPGTAYEGSSVLGAMKAGQERGWYGEYRWAFNEMDLRLAISWQGPAVLGINWHDGMSIPDSDGFIAPTGAVLGGHAILCVGYDARRDAYRLHNSWGRSWGIRGDCFIRAKDLEWLLHCQGEACIPIVRKAA